MTGAVALAEFAHVVAAKYGVTIGLHTDHCPKDKLDTYVRPLLAISQERVDAGKNPLFQSHMWDGSAVPIDENLLIAQELLSLSAAAKIILEIEIGVVGGEEDGVEAAIDDKLFTTPRTSRRPSMRSASARRAATCWPPPSATCTACTSPATSNCVPTCSTPARRLPPRSSVSPKGSKPFDFVFHGGSGSLKSEIEESLSYGVVKMNVDTDTQYATPARRRPHVQQLRRCAEGRRRRGQQEGVRPAQLVQAGRDLDE